MIFDFRSFRTQFTEILTKWVDSSNEFKRARSPYFRKVYADFAFIENVFLELSKAIESYSREVLGTSDDEYTFENRLDEILENSVSGIDYIDKLIVERDDFLRKIIDSRNYYTHNDHRRKLSIVKGLELYILIPKLTVLLNSLFLMELGFAKDVINTLFFKNRIFNSYLTTE